MSQMLKWIFKIFNIKYIQLIDYEMSEEKSIAKKSKKIMSQLEKINNKINRLTVEIQHMNILADPKNDDYMKYAVKADQFFQKTDKKIEKLRNERLKLEEKLKNL